MRYKIKHYVQQGKNRFANLKRPADSRDAVKYCRTRKSFTTPLPIQKWNDLYSDIETFRVNNIIIYHEVSCDRLERAISLREFEKALRATKCDKAPRSDQISFEFINAFPEYWFVSLKKMYNSTQ